ncbi:MAG: hypothetical protein KBD00_05970 [Candidatus Peribacteraceae bacterium]|nr:hypothetical protein [Candidatus Peribacteraceae bacterium]
MKHRVLQIASLIVLIGACYYIYLQLKPHIPVKNPDPNHTHADFAVWIDGRMWGFSKEKYMSGLSTEDHSTGEHGEKDLYFHLHDSNGHVIHSHKPGLPLAQFFTSLGWTFADGCFLTDTAEKFCDDTTKTWQMYVNGTKQTFDLTYVFADGDKILLTYGNDEQMIEQQLQQLTDDACKYSKTCPWKGSPPTENCIADPAVPCKIVP